MKKKITTGLIRNCTCMILLVLSVIPGAETTAEAATYAVGDTVTNFSFVARGQFTRPDGTVVSPGDRVYLHDFAGHIIFFEWFAVWCPYCQAAAPQVRSGIVDWYESRHGNPFQVPVLHLAVNQESASFYQTATDNFIDQQAFRIVVNDYDANSVNSVRFMFQSSGQPIFAVINGVTNSPSHQAWECLVNYLGYGQTDFNQTLASFREIIDTVQAPQPVLSKPLRIGSDFEFSVQTEPGRPYRIQRSTDLTNWTTLTAINATTNTITFHHTNAPPMQGFYRAVTP